MKNRARKGPSMFSFLLLILSLAAARNPAAPGADDDVFRHPQPSQPLSKRWEWGLAEAKKYSLRNDCWVGYSIERTMPRNERLSYFASRRRNYPTLAEVVHEGKPLSSQDLLPEDERLMLAIREALDELDGKPAPLIRKEVALLFLQESGGRSIFEKAAAVTMDTPFDLRGNGLVWLGRAANKESLEWLTRAYGLASMEDEKEHIVHAVALHQEPELVFQFLKRILEGRQPESVREEAASSLAELNDEKALQLLVQTSQFDASLSVREEAVSAIGDMTIPSAVDALIYIAQKADHAELRREAVSSLAKIASKKAREALEKFAFDGGETKIQVHAVEALAELEDDEGIPCLIKIARTHPDPAVRKRAIACLGDIEDERAVETLIELARGKHDIDVKRPSSG